MFMSTTRYTSTLDMEQASFFSTSLNFGLHDETVKSILEAASIRYPKDDLLMGVYTTFIGTFLSNLIQSRDNGNNLLAFSTRHCLTRLPEYETPEWKKLTEFKRKKIMAAMKTLGFVVQYSRGQSLAKHSRACLSLYRAGPNLHSAFDWVSINHEKLKVHQSTIVRDVAKVERPIMTHETVVLDSYNPFWMGRVNFIADPMRAIFKHDTNLNGRLYSNYMNMSEERRTTIMIDGEPTAEVDFSASHMNILSLWKECSTINDAYSRIMDNIHDKTISRDDVKTAVMRYTNSNNPSSNLQYCLKWSDVKTNTTLKAIEQTFPFMLDIKGKQFGLVSMRVEGLIAIRMIQWAMENNEVILPVHDSFICREAIRDRVEAEMERVREEVVREFNFDEAMKSLEDYKAAKKAALKAKKVRMSDEDKVELIGEVTATCNRYRNIFHERLMDATCNPELRGGFTASQYAVHTIPKKVALAVLGLNELWKEEGFHDPKMDAWRYLLQEDIKRIEKGRLPQWYDES